MLDNVVEFNGLPLKQQRNEITTKRRHGMGYLGLGSALTMLRIKYGSDEAIKFTELVTRTLAIEGLRMGVELAKEKGEAPILTRKFAYKDIPNSRKKGKTPVFSGSKTGRQLWLQSEYLENLFDSVDEPKLKKDLAKYGCRFTHHSSIAPTGCCLSSTRIRTADGIKSYQQIMDDNGIDWKAIEKTNNKQWIPLKPFKLPSKDLIEDDCDKIWYNGHEPTYLIEFEDGTTFECTGNHKLLVKQGKYLVWIEASTLNGDEDIVSY